MNLIERYLEAISFWLPKANRENNLRELSEDLHSQVEAGEAALGRPLEEEEVSDILIRTGNPKWVAGQYQHQRTWLFQLLPRIFQFVQFIFGALLFSSAFQIFSNTSTTMEPSNKTSSIVFINTLHQNPTAD